MLTTLLLLECTGAGAGARATQDHCLATDLDDLRHGSPPPLSCQGLCCRQVRPHVANRLLSSISCLVQEHNLSTCFRSNLEDIRASHACVPNPCFASQPNPLLCRNTCRRACGQNCLHSVLSYSSSSSSSRHSSNLLLAKLTNITCEHHQVKKKPGRGALSATES